MDGALQGSETCVVVDACVEVVVETFVVVGACVDVVFETCVVVGACVDVVFETCVVVGAVVDSVGLGVEVVEFLETGPGLHTSTTVPTPMHSFPVVTLKKPCSPQVVPQEFFKV